MCVEAGPRSEANRSASESRSSSSSGSQTLVPDVLLIAPEKNGSKKKQTKNGKINVSVGANVNGSREPPGYQVKNTPHTS